MYRIFPFIFLIFLACSEKKVIIEESKFIDILSDIHLAESLTDRIDTSVLMQNYHYNHFQEEIFKKHHIDSTQYKDSYEFYTKDVIKAQVIYDKVLNKLQERLVK
ncbi:MAG: DUF4296 domain-containing protein [Bacteroidetes bacterium]|nr:DUF4296 domain-containing protein [Bacteroidota bacterium]